MNSPIVRSNTFQMGSTSGYTTLQPMSMWSISFSPIQRSSIVTFVAVPLAKTTTEGPTVLKPAPLPEDNDARIEEFLRFLDSFESEIEETDGITTEK